MKNRFLLTIFLLISPFVLWAQNNPEVFVKEASGTAFTLARGNNIREFSSNLKGQEDLPLQPGDILTTKEKTTIEISIGNKNGRIKLGENTSVIFVHATEGKNSAFILTKGIVKIRNREDIPGNSIFVRTDTLSAEVLRGEAGLWVHPKQRGSADTKTEVFCLTGKAEIFVLKKTDNNSWYDKDPEYDEHFLKSGIVLSVRSDQAPFALEESMTQNQKIWWDQFDFGKDTSIVKEATPEETQPNDSPAKETESTEVAKEQEPTPPEQEDDVIDDEVKDSFKQRKPLREKLQRTGAVTVAGSSAMMLTGIITYAAVPPENKNIGTVLTSIGAGGALTGLIVFLSSYAFPSEKDIVP